MLDTRIAEIATEPNIKGIKARWFWGDIESDAGGQYDWSAIEHALHQCALAGKYLVVGIQDRNFGGGTTAAHAKAVLPDYLVDTYGYYTIGSGTGVASKIYLPAVTDRYIAMMKDMARHFADHPDLPHLEAVYSGETAVGNGNPGEDYDRDVYVEQRKRAGAAMASFWPRTNVIQGFNFIPGDLADFMRHIDRHRLAMGGPDIFHAEGDGLTSAQKELTGLTGNDDYRGKVPVMFDIQGADYDFDRGDGVNPTLPADLFKVAYQQLRASHIFWVRFTTGTPAQNWSTGILPFINSIGGLTHREQPINYGGGLPRIVECEAFDFTATPSAVEVRTEPRDVLFKAANVGDTIVFRVPNLPAGTYNIDVVVQKGPDRGQFQLESDAAIDGAYASTHGAVQETCDANSLSGQTLAVAAGVNIPSTGTRFFRFRVTGKTGSGYHLGLDRLILTATGAPGIVVKGRATPIADGDATPSVDDDTDFGSADFHAGAIEKTYTIENTGSGPLIVGSVLAGGDTDYRDFGVLNPPPFSIAAGASATFTAAFTPQGAGNRTATVRLLNNDAGAGSFDYAIRGRGLDGPDTVAPVISSLTASPNVLWSPNHQMVPVTLAVTLSDNLDPAPTARIVSVACSEAGADPSFEITGNLTLNLRAERAGSGPGRLYTIRVEGSDASGNVTFANVHVTVPHDKGRDRTAPVVAIASPGAGSGVTGAATVVSAEAFDDVAMAGVQFKLDGTLLGAERTVAPYAISWDTTTLPDGPHTLTAVARDLSGNVTVSSPVEVVVINPPGAPSGLVATAVSATQVDLAWTDGSANETQFRVERRAGGDAYTSLGTAPADAVAFSDTTAAPGLTYTYRVRAENAAGASAWSGESSVTTPGPLTVEFETATIAVNTRPYVIRTNPNDVLFQSNADGAYITFLVPGVSAGTYAIAVRLQAGQNRGKFQLESSATLDGTYTPHGAEEDTYIAGFSTQTRTITPSTTIAESGPRYFRFRVTGRNDLSNNRYLALDQMTLTPLAGLPAAVASGDASQPDGGTATSSPSAGTAQAASPADAASDADTPRPAVVALDGLRQPYDGTPRVVIATTEPAGADVEVTYDGSPVAPTNPGSYEVVATVAGDGPGGRVTDTLVVAATALVRHGPDLNGDIDGSLQVLLGESFGLNGSAMVSGDILVPGSPTHRLNGHPLLVAVRDGTGRTEPSNYQVTLNDDTLMRYLVRRTDPPEMPLVTAPPAPAGIRNVSLNMAGQSAGDFATVRNLTLDGTVGAMAVPPGTYGTLTANGGSGFILGVAGATTPAVYNLQTLALNGSSALTVAGPVIVSLAGGVVINGNVGAPDHPDWLTLHVAAGGVTLNGNVAFHGTVIAPNGTVTVNGNSTLHGTVACDRLTINDNGLVDEP